MAAFKCKPRYIWILYPSMAKPSSAANILLTLYDIIERFCLFMPRRCLSENDAIISSSPAFRHPKQMTLITQLQRGASFFWKKVYLLLYIQRGSAPLNTRWQKQTGDCSPSCPACELSGTSGSALLETQCWSRWRWVWSSMVVHMFF